MIDSVEIKNFKSILQAKIKFSPLTVLVGTNGAGKSNLTLALAFLSHVSNHGLAAAVNHFGGFRSLLPQIEAFSGQKPKSAPERLSFCVSMSLPPSQADHADSPLTVKYELEFGYADLANLDAPAAEPVRITHEKMSFDQFLPPAGILLADFTAQAHTFRTRVSAIRKYDLPLVSTPIEASQNGGHLEAPAATSAVAPSALASICQPERKASWNRILRTLATVAPHVEFVPPHSRPADPPPTLVPARRLAVPLGVCGQEPPVEGSQAVPELVEGQGIALGGDQRGTGSLNIDSWELSGGTARALGILLALETHPEDGTLLIEEPEQSLHPWAIRAVMEHIREVACERNIQVILTTHSPMVLERVYPEEVRIVERSEQKGTIFKTIKEILPYSDIAMGEVGELWVHGLLGGVPSYE